MIAFSLYSLIRLNAFFFSFSFGGGHLFLKIPHGIQKNPWWILLWPNHPSIHQHLLANMIYEFPLLSMRLHSTDLSLLQYYNQYTDIKVNMKIKLKSHWFGHCHRIYSLRWEVKRTYNVADTKCNHPSQTRIAQALWSSPRAHIISPGAAEYLQL